MNMSDDGTWVAGPMVDQLTPESPLAAFAEGTPVIVLIERDQVRVYLNACPHQGLPLDGGEISDGVLHCPFHGWRFAVLGGECVQKPTETLTPVPSRVQEGRVWIQKPAV